MPVMSAPASTKTFEALGTFYLGRRYDLASEQLTTEPVLYDSRDLVTHGVVVGMTGSGKTGLGITLLEEALIDSIPVIAIDPKGDLANLLLTFPNLAPGDFKPWVDAEEAARQEQTVDAFAAAEAEKWKKGLAEWGQDGARIAKLRETVDFAVYTPGSRAGIPVSILRSFAAPPAAERDDDERMAEAVTTTATSVLTLLGVDADPVQSREHILLAAILNHAWCGGGGSGSGGDHPAHPAAAVHARRRAGSGSVLSGEGSLRAGDAPERPAGRAELRDLAGRPAARHREHVDVACRQAALRDRLDRALERHGADVLRHAAAQSGRELDAGAIGHDEPARAALHGRSRGLHAAGIESAVEGGDAAVDEAGARLRIGRRARDAKSGRSRLQGIVERRHVVSRTASDGAR